MRAAMLARAAVLFTLAVCILVARPARAEEGMWTFDDVPTLDVQRALGVTLDRPWLDHLRRAAVRLSTGCSAAVVSRQGLALTNGHCVMACAEALSRGGADPLRQGFLTDGMADERRCPQMRAEILTAIYDVTGPIFAAGAGKVGEAFVAAREAAISEAEAAACRGDARLRCQVISFFGGGQFKVYRYRLYDDVRLAFAPEFQMAFFGGDPDNFTFPRFDLDCAFVRLYEARKPAATPDFLAWSSRPPAGGEAVFVAGNPATSERALTVAQLETLRDVALPIALAQRAELRGRLIAFSQESAENRRIATAALFEEENALKVARQRSLSLADPAFMAARRREEGELKAGLAVDRRVADQIGDPWADIAALREVYADQFIVWRQLETAAGGGSRLFAYARLLVRGAVERAKPSALRLPEFADSRLPLIEKSLIEDAPAPPALERLQLEFWLSKTREYLGADSPVVTAALGRESPEALAARLASGSRLGDPLLRRALWRGGLAAIEASDDPMIAFVVKSDVLARAARRLWEDEVAGPSERAAERIERLRLALGAGGVYPDATFSLRLSYGKVAGWSEAGTQVGPFSTLGGLYARATGAEPYRLAPRWLAARAKLDPATVLDFSTTNDILGGNSGSPVVNADGAVVGTAFDGNLSSIAGDFAYDGARNRTLVVSTAAIAEALDKVYGRHALLKELEAR